MPKSILPFIAPGIERSTQRRLRKKKMYGVCPLSIKKIFGLHKRRGRNPFFTGRSWGGPRECYHLPSDLRYHRKARICPGEL